MFSTIDQISSRSLKDQRDAENQEACSPDKMVRRDEPEPTAGSPSHLFCDQFSSDPAKMGHCQAASVCSRAAQYLTKYLHCNVSECKNQLIEKDVLTQSAKQKNTKQPWRKSFFVSNFLTLNLKHCPYQHKSNLRHLFSVWLKVSQ